MNQKVVELKFIILTQLSTPSFFQLGRMKGAWRLLPTAICVDGQLAAPTGEQCWNGEKIAPYRRIIVSSGVSSQKRNPEFGKELKVSRGKF